MVKFRLTFTTTADDPHAKIWRVEVLQSSRWFPVIDRNGTIGGIDDPDPRDLIYCANSESEAYLFARKLYGSTAVRVTVWR